MVYIVIWFICFVVSYLLFRCLGVMDFGRVDECQKGLFLILSLFGPVSLIMVFAIWIIAADRGPLYCIGKILP